MKRSPEPTTRWIERASSGRSGTRIARWKSPVLPGGAGWAAGSPTSSTSGVSAPSVTVSPSSASARSPIVAS